MLKTILLLVTLCSLNTYAQRAKTNTVEEVEILITQMEDEFVRARSGKNIEYRYSLVKAYKPKIKDKGKVHLYIKWNRISLKPKRKSTTKEMLKEIRTRKYAPSRLINVVFDHECTDFETLNLTMRAKIIDPDDDLKKYRNIKYKNKEMYSLKHIDTTKYCNGFVPKKLVIHSR
jgi:hypothetical protein